MSDFVPKRGQRTVQPGDKPGESVEPPTLPGKKFGNGTANDPYICWACPGWEDLDPAVIDAHNRIAREKAILYKCQCVIIRAEVHGTTTLLVYNDNNELTKEIKAADTHFTVYMGKDAFNCYLQGHIYVVATKEGMRAATPADRRIVHDGYEPVGDEMWPMNKQQGYRPGETRDRQSPGLEDATARVTKWADASDRERQSVGKFTDPQWRH